MTEGPIAVEYVEIRTAPGAKQDFERDVRKVAEPAGQQVSRSLQDAIRDGLRTPAGAAGTGAAIGTIVGQGAARALAASLRGVGAVFRTGLSEVKDYQAGLSQLQAGLKSTGGAAGLTADQMEALASSIQKYSGQTDDSIVQAEGLLLTFSKIRDQGPDKIFTRATQAAADLAQRMGTDASSAALQLGKALNDPVRGMTALQRSGIQFDEQQTKTIKKLVETGDQLGAQKIILAEVEHQVGGSAKAYGETLPGQLDRSKRAFEDLTQQLIGSAAPALEKTATLTTSVVETLGKLGPTVPLLIGGIGALYGATKAVKAYQEIRDTLFTRTAKTVAANEAVAVSYTNIAEAATAAGIAERGAAGAGGGVPTAIAGRGLLASVGAGGAAVGIAAGGTLAAGIHSIGTVKGNQAIQEMQKRLREAGAPDVVLRGFDLTLRDKLLGHPNTAGTLAAGQAYLDALGRRDHRDAVGPVQAALEAEIARAGGALASARGVFADPTKRAAEAASLAGVFGGAFSALPSDHAGDAGSAREARRQADRRVAAAERALAAARRGGAGASVAQIDSAEASILTARDALHRKGGNAQAEQLRLEAAESRLATLRAKGGASTDKVRAAEDRLSEARRKAKGAAAEVAKAEAPAGLSLEKVLANLGGQVKHSQRLRDDSKKLIKDGVSQGVLEELDKLEQTAPGTLDKVAKSLTPTLAKQLNSQYAALQKVQQEFLTAPLRAAVEAAKAKQERLVSEAADQQVAPFLAALTTAGVKLASGRTPNTPDPAEHGVHLHITGAPAAQVHSIARQTVKNAQHFVGAGVF